MSRFIGLDIGTSSVKAVAVDESGAVLGRAEQAHQLRTPQRGWAEQDPEDWWRGANLVLDELAVDAADGIGLTGQMHGLVALDARGEVLRPAILWNDGRAQPQCDALEAELGIEGLVDATGNRALAGFTGPKLRWMAENEPDAHARIRHVLMPKDEVRRRLTGGEVAQDPSDASGTLLLDVGRRSWSPLACEAMRTDARWLPPVIDSDSVAGHLEVGGRRIPVATGAGDQAAGALGVGVTVAGGPASVVLGTSGVVFAATEAFRPDRLGRLHTFCHAPAATWHTMGVALTAAGALTWLRSVVGGDWSELVHEAAAWQPGAEGLLFAPYLAGERTPHANARARGGFLGLSLRHDRGALARAVLEGVAFALRDSFDLVCEQVARPSVARVSGGGARSTLWLEILAAVLDTPVERVAVDEGAAYGAALLAGAAVGAYATAAEAAERCVRVTERIEPRPDWVEAYDALRAAFSSAYPALEDVRSMYDRRAG